MGCLETVICVAPVGIRVTVHAYDLDETIDDSDDDDGYVGWADDMYMQTCECVM